ncbi:multicopper oxidase family protein [Oceanibium sediminis]|uniref:multicopper oxidase family protein n=1 Tax=Oceanibium sediminis TaxID=2026339 RepID=UPI000DD364DD|nr:multicopper oxidase family protein [Oceanibium sediminis]
MRLTRRQMLATGAAALLVPGRSRAATQTLVAKPGEVQLAPVGLPATPVWTFGGTTPGPELRLQQGKPFELMLDNALPEATTVHWHGIRVPNAMDGVAGLTQDPVLPGAGFRYAFTPPDAGTYWYHAHMNSVEQLSRGLSGPLVVEETDPPDVDRDEVLFLRDWRLVDPANVSPDFDNHHDMAHAGRLGNFVTVNAMTEQRQSVPRYSRLRLRLINAATDRVFELATSGLSGAIVAVDGMPVEAPLPIGQIFLGPGQRADLIVDVTAPEGEDALVADVFRGETFALASFTVTAPERERRAPDIPPLAQNPAQALALDLDAARIEPMEMQGGAMRGLRSGTYQGEQMDGRALATKGQYWSLNGQVNMPDAPWLTLSAGETLRIPFINATAFPHAMHLHGHHFREVYQNGTLGLWRDTILVDPGQVREVAFHADNPGRWLLHCHMLSHRMSGMATWIEVI